MYIPAFAPAVSTVLSTFSVRSWFIRISSKVFNFRSSGMSVAKKYRDDCRQRGHSTVFIPSNGSLLDWKRLSRHGSKQNECWHGSIFGLFICSKQMEHSKSLSKSWFFLSIAVDLLNFIQIQIDGY